jgi:hypothetical protein
MESMVACSLVIVKSNYTTECAACKQTIHTGDNVLWFPGQSLVSHAVCPIPGEEEYRQLVGKNPNLLAFRIMAPVYNDEGDLAYTEKEVGMMYSLSKEDAERLLRKRVSQGHYMKATRLERVL